MIRKRLFHLAQLAAVGFTGYLVGQNKDRLLSDEERIVVDGRILKSMPGLPIFGTVSAATAFVEGGSNRDRVSVKKKNFSSWL